MTKCLESAECQREGCCCETDNVTGVVSCTSLTHTECLKKIELNDDDEYDLWSASFNLGYPVA
jgi:hypothetical protein